MNIKKIILKLIKIIDMLIDSQNDNAKIELEKLKQEIKYTNIKSQNRYE